MEFFFSKFMEKLYIHPWLRNTTFVLFVERNIQAGPHVVENVMARYSRHYIIREPGDSETLGWWTNHVRKSLYVVSGAEQMRENKIFMLRDMVCTNPWLNRKDRLRSTLDGLYDQLPRFKERDPPPGSERKFPIISGCIDDQGRKIQGAKDDRALTFFMALCVMDWLLKRKMPGVDYRMFM